jgi:hypothetical protein
MDLKEIGCEIADWICLTEDKVQRMAVVSRPRRLFWFIKRWKVFDNMSDYQLLKKVSAACMTLVSDVWMNQVHALSDGTLYVNCLALYRRRKVYKCRYILCAANGNIYILKTGKSQIDLVHTNIFY